MPRLTRQQSQQLTRQKLIETAEKEILRVGIYEASIRQICDAAGHTLGAFYSNFKDKDELLFEVVALHTKRELEILNNLAETAVRLEEEKALEKLAEWLRELQKNRILSSFSLEFEVYASHNLSFKKRYTENKKKWHDELAKTLEIFFQKKGLIPKIPFTQMALGLTSLWSGLFLEGSVPGADPADKIIPLFLEALLESSKRKHGSAGNKRILHPSSSADIPV